MIEKLKNILLQEDTVLFIGSGISLWSGLPSWTGLLKELINLLKINGLDTSLTEQELGKGDLLQAASYGLDMLTKPEFANFVRNACRLGTAQPHPIHQNIVTLGPTCYITTNYDNLLELSFYKWAQGNYFRKVVNNQLLETAEIVGARAKNFLFKLHGDAEDSRSIILTREHYRALNMGGEFYHALETTKALMLSRPIVYIGFGLKDPDFLLLKDLIFNTFKGGARDHYAIMADLNPQEVDYYRKQYGIHLIGYKTIPKPDGSRDHSPLIELLGQLKSVTTVPKPLIPILGPAFILGLNRHAAKYLSFEKSPLDLPLVVHHMRNQEEPSNEIYSPSFYETSVEKLLDNGPEKLILIGVPGSGKSYSLQGSVKRLATNLNKECIEDKIKTNKTVIPIYIDLKLYQGNIIDLIEQHIPAGISIQELCSNFRVRLYLDGFNEIPKQYIESNQWSADFNTLLRNLAFSLIISSRTDDGLRDLRIPIFNLDSIDKNFIISNLTQNQLELKGIFRDDILTILQKPFFYKLVYENKFQIDLQTTPRKIYSNLLSLIYQRFVQKFEIEIDLSSSLSKAAMDAMDAGQEVFDADVLKKYIELELMNCQHPPNSIDIINWLVSQNFLIPIKNERVSFFHQSVTEYLAATRLATLFSANNAILKEKLKYRRWDQTIYLTLSLLKESDSNIFLDILLKIDFELAISATKYIEHHSDKIVAYLLEKVLDIKDLSNLSFRIADILSTSVPLSGVHLPALRKLIKKANILGGAAVECVINLLGNSFKEEALQLLLDNYDNFNFCSTIGKSLKPYITKDDLPNIISKCKEVQEKLNGYAIESIEDCDGFIEALSHLLANNSPQWLYATLFNPEIPAEKQTVHVAILDHILQDSESQKALEIYLSLLFAKGNNISTGLSLLLEFSKYQLDYSVVTIQHINALLFCLQIGEEHNQRGALQSLYQICKVREDLTVRILQEAEKNSGILKAALYYIISQDGKHNMIFNSLEELLKKDLSTLDLEPFYLLVELYKLNWKGQERLFVNLLKLRNNELARYLCAGVTGNFGEQSHLNLEIGPINWWLDWFSEYEGIHSWFFLDRVVTTIVQFIDYDKRREFIKEFNIPTSIYRQVISQVFLIRYDELTLRDFTDESITFLLENLNKTMGIFHFDSHPLEKIATEAFVSEVMIPRLSLVSGEKKNNLRTLIEKIGKRHNRRYLID